MYNKLKFLDPIIATGAIISISLSIILVLIGQDQAISLLIGLVIAAITLLIDIIARIQESEEKIIHATELETTLVRNPLLLSIVSQIANDYVSVKKLGADFFMERADNSLLETRDIIHRLAEGRMTQEVVDVGKARFIYGSRPAKRVKVASYADPSFWRTEYGKFIFKQNARAVKRGIEFTYVWIQKRKTLVEYQDILKLQQDMGVKTLYVFPDEVPGSFLEHYRIKDDEMLFKYELTVDGRTKTQHISIDPIEVDTAVRNFKVLLRYTHNFNGFEKDD